MTNDQFAEYQCRVDLNLYDSPTCERLATQASAGRHLRVLSTPDETAVKVCLCEDDYPGWLHVEDLHKLEPATTPYQAVVVSEAEIKNRLPAVIAFAKKAMQQPNYYLWGGTLGPNYDCSGLVQAAFASVGIWLPRDSYQQQAFTQSVALKDLQPGDLIYFGKDEKITHVSIYLGGLLYIHSSGIEQGRNGIGIDCLSEEGDEISQCYYRQLRSCGRVIESYSGGRKNSLN